MVALRDKFIRVVLKAFISKAFAGAGVLFLNLILGYYYGAAGVGKFMFMLSLLAGMSMCTRAGMDNAMVRDLSRYYIDGDMVKFQEGILCAFVWAFLSSVLLVFAALLIDSMFGRINISSPILYALPFYSSIYLQSSVLKSIGYVAIAPFFEIGSAAAFLCVFIVLFHNAGASGIQYAEWGFLFATIAIFLAGIFFLVRKLFFVEHNPLSASIRKVLVLPWVKFNGLGSFFMLSCNAFFLQWGIILVLSLFLGQAELGVFSLAHRATLLISFVLIVLNGVASPKFSHLFSVRDINGLQHLVHRIFWIGLFVSFAMYFIAAIGSIYIGRFIPSTEGIQYLILIFGAAQVVNVVTGPAPFLLMMTGNEMFLNRYVLASSLLLLCFVCYFAKSFGVFGAVLAFSVVESAKNIGLMISIKKILGLTVFPKWRGVR